MNNAVDEFLNSINGEQKPEDIFKKESSDPFKVEEPKIETEEVKEEKPLPFNKDPKVQRYIDKEISKRLESIQPTTTEKFIKETTVESDELSDVLTRIIGNDTPEKLSAIKDFKKAIGNLEERGAQKAIEQLQAQKDAEVNEEKEAVEQLTTAFENIEETHGIDLTSNSAKARDERGHFIDFIARISRKDQDGNVTQYPDIEETYNLFKETRKTDTASKAKELSNRSMARSTDASTIPQNTDTSWNAVERLFSKLNK